MLVSTPHAAAPQVPPMGPVHASARPLRLPRETWSFGLALAAVLVVKAGWVTSVPW